MIAVIDYGAGNLRSVVNAFEFIGMKPLITCESSDLEKASAIVLPGVGAFGDGVDNLRRLNLIETLEEEVLVKKKPYLGICLGLQFLASESQEHGKHLGLGWINAVVRRLQPSESKYRIPHMGWNNVRLDRSCPLFEGIEDESAFYFVHSYHFIPEDGDRSTVVATAWHGEPVVAAVQRENVFGVQFHPEKSQKDGLTLLENFVKMM